MRRTLTIPAKPIEHTVAAEAKYAERSIQMTLSPSTRHPPIEVSHSLSGSHLSDLQAAKTWTVKAKLVTAPKRVITREADLS